MPTKLPDTKWEALTLLRKQIDAISFDSNPDLEWIKSATDGECLRFLEGHGLQVPKAFELMMACSIWRNAYKPDDLLLKYDQPEDPVGFDIRFAKAYFPIGILGPDREGHPVFLNRMGMVDCKLNLDSIVSRPLWFVPITHTRDPKTHSRQTQERFCFDFF
jgi:hypothetical protein